MTVDRDQFKALAAQLRDLQDATKESLATFNEKVAGQGIDPAGLRRFVSWKRQDEQKRAQREAVDQQCRYLAGERDTPAELPIGCELARALNCFRRNMTVRQVAEELGVSTGKAGKLRELARMFDVHVHARVDKPRRQKLDVISPPETATLPSAPPHDPETGVIPPEPAGVSPVNAGGDNGPEPQTPEESAGADRRDQQDTRGPEGADSGVRAETETRVRSEHPEMVMREVRVRMPAGGGEVGPAPVSDSGITRDVIPAEAVSDTDESCGGTGAQPGAGQGPERVAEPSGLTTVSVVRQPPLDAGVAPGPHDTPMPEGPSGQARPPVEEDTLEIPDFLRASARRTEEGKAA